MNAAQQIVKNRQDTLLEQKLNEALLPHSSRFANLDCIFDSELLADKFKEFGTIAQAHESFAMQCLYSAYQVILGDVKVEVPS